jgi:mono/diheme cytochrome c family protein
MKRTLVALLALACAVALVSCGQKAADSGSSPSSSSTPSASSGTASTPSSGPAAVSQYDSGPRAGESPVNAALVAQGAKLFKDKGCSACHGFGKRLTCPDLQGVSMRRTTTWMENQILHPDVMVKEDPIAHDLFAKFMLQMPKQGLTADEASAVIEFFKDSDHKAGLTKAVSH